MRKLYGFTLSFSKGSGKIEYTLNHDDFSVREYEDDQVHVVVQTSWKASDSAKDIAVDYKAHKKSSGWTPSRYTNGSFAVVDKKDGEVYVGRDRTYASHLYYYSDGNRHLYTTDNADLLNYCKVLDAEALDMMLWNNIKVMAALPIVKGSKAILPGHFCRHVPPYTGGGQTAVFWKIGPCGVPSNYEDAVNRYGELLVDSIKNNISNDEAAVWLSGGSDSAAIMGALHKLGVGNVQAAHMYYKGNFDFEHDDVNALQRIYGFNLKNVTPDVHSEEWRKFVDDSLLNVTINSFGISIPSFVFSGKYLQSVVTPGTTAMVGEMCLLDAGFTEQNDKTRKIRRWLYRGGGRHLAMGIKMLPESCCVDWECQRALSSHTSKAEKVRYLLKLMQSILYAMGRPKIWYSGMKIGRLGGLLPIPSFSGTFFSDNFETHRWNRLCEGVFDEFEESLKNNKWTAAIDTMLCNWYSEFSNFSMTADACSLSGLQYCFPFSSVDFLDFQSSLPEKWKIDKKIQKDMCYKYLGMPHEVAYRNKNHGREVPYDVLVYPFMQTSEFNKEFEEMVNNTDFGPLTIGIKKSLGNMWANRKFALYALMLWIHKYNLYIE